ncbi:D-beta-hydroxybutyrate dehydrogenase, mitochondrial-like [Amphiura filiformis]|uniref:D-beta-hydroxybutyrate dehydrogenase, mitochondrial-like n=1 Tax=Amphiura filiformis TaxID=82378 RepID=UPI003B21077B
MPCKLSKKTWETKVSPFDVTKDEEIDNALQTVKEDLGDEGKSFGRYQRRRGRECLQTVKEDLVNEGLWGLVNNAGVLLFAEVELTPIRTFQQHFDVNCLGQVRMVKAFLPLIKRAKGRIVNFSSIAARTYITMNSAYNMSKAGVEVFSDVLRLEMIKWGVKVSIIFPSVFNTNMTQFGDRQEKFLDEIKETLNKSQKMYYNALYFKKVIERSKGVDVAAGKSTANYLADYSPIFLGVDHALLSQTPKARYNLGFGCSLIMAVLIHLPNWLLDFLLTFSPITYREIDLEPRVNMKFE